MSEISHAVVTPSRWSVWTFQGWRTRRRTASTAGSASHEVSTAWRAATAGAHVWRKTRPRNPLERLQIGDTVYCFSFWNTQLKCENETSAEIASLSALLFFSPCLFGHLGESRTISPTSWVPTRLSVQPSSKTDRRRRGGHRAQGRLSCSGRIQGNNTRQGLQQQGVTIRYHPVVPSTRTHPCSPLTLHPGSLSLPQLHSTVNCEMRQHPGNGFRFPANTPTSQGAKVLPDVVSCDASPPFLFYAAGIFFSRTISLQGNIITGRNMLIHCVYGHLKTSNALIFQRNPRDAFGCHRQSVVKTVNPSRKIRFPISISLLVLKRNHICFSNTLCITVRIRIRPRIRVIFTSNTGAKINAFGSGSWWFKVTSSNQHELHSDHFTSFWGWCENRWRSCDGLVPQPGCVSAARPTSFI